MHGPLRWLRYDFLSNEVSFRRKEWTISITVWALSSASSAASSADALAPVSVIYRSDLFDIRGVIWLIETH